MEKALVCLEPKALRESIVNLCARPAESLNGDSTDYTNMRHLWDEYHRSYSQHSLKEIIRINRAALSMGNLILMENTNCGNVLSLVHYSTNLAIALIEHYKHTGGIADLDESIELLEHAHSRYTECNLSYLDVPLQVEVGRAYRSRFLHTGNLEDIQHALGLHDYPASLSPKGSVERSIHCAELSATLLAEFTQSSSRTSLSRALELIDEAMEGVAAEGAFQQDMEMTCAQVNFTQCRATGDMVFWDKAVAMSKHVLETRHGSHPELWMAHNRLANCFLLKWLQTNSDSDQNNSIHHGRVAFHLLHPENPSRIQPAIPLSSMLQGRHEAVGTVDDLNESLAVLQACRDFEHRDHPKIISRLAAGLAFRFNLLGVSEDLDDAIAMQRAALQEEPPNAPFKLARIGTLANLLDSRFTYRTDNADLAEAEEILRVGLKSSNGVSENIGRASIQLAGILCEYHKKTGETSKLNDAIALFEDMELRFVNKEGYDKDTYWLMYSQTRVMRYRLLGLEEDLSHATFMLRKALEARPKGHVNRHNVLLPLSSALTYQYQINHKVEDVEEAKDLLLEATESLSTHHPDHSIMLFELAQLHLMAGTSFFSIAEALTHAMRAVDHDHQSAEQCLIGVLKFLQAISPFINDNNQSINNTSMGTLLDFYMAAADLLPRVAYFGLDINSRLRVLEASKQLATDGASLALILKNPSAAIEMLEQGRTVFWTQHLRLRTSFDELPQHLASALREAAVALDQNSRVVAMTLGNIGTATNRSQMDNVQTRSRRLSDEFDRLVNKARALPGFKHFMRPEPFDSLRPVADRGPVVVLVAHDKACHAIVMVDPHNISHVSLPDLHALRLHLLLTETRLVCQLGRRGMQSRAIKQVIGKPGTYALEGVLETLWQAIFIPIMAQITELGSSKSHDKRRLFICPTGALTNLPIHAAGIYQKALGSAYEGTQCVSDTFVVSYTPTLGALLNARRQIHPQSLADLKVLATCVSAPPSWRPLRYAQSEISIVHDLAVQATVTIITDRPTLGAQVSAMPTMDAVLDKLPETAILHFACHGHQNRQNPLHSGFILKDGVLTVSKIMSLRLDQAFFAFLSACETAKGDGNQPDQAIHLAAALFFSGFKSVIGTLWSMNDVDGPFVAQVIYEELFRPEKQDLDLDSIPFALDRAVQQLRAKGISAKRWATYVHIGV